MSIVDDETQDLTSKTFTAVTPRWKHSDNLLPVYFSSNVYVCVNDYVTDAHTHTHRAWRQPGAQRPDSLRQKQQIQEEVGSFASS